MYVMGGKESLKSLRLRVAVNIDFLKMNWDFFNNLNMYA